MIFCISLIRSLSDRFLQIDPVIYVYWSLKIPPIISQTLTSMLTCVTDGALAAASSCTFTGFCPGLAAHCRSFRPTDPHTSPRRAAADSTDSFHYYGPARKSSLLGHGDAPAPARFYRFPRGPSIYLAACKAKKK